MDHTGFERDENGYNTFPSKETDVIRNRNDRTELNDVAEVKEKVELKKTIGFCSCVGILVGSIIGSGIFISPKGVLVGSGSVGLTLVVWSVCGAFSFFGASSFAELGVLIPNSGGSYTYMLECFAPKRRAEKLFWGPFIGYLYNWQYTLFQRPVMFVVQGMACATYLIKLKSIGCISQDKDKTTDAVQIKLLSVIVMSLITAVNCYSVKASTRLINVFAVAKVTSLLFIILGGIVQLSQGTNEALSTGFRETDFSTDGLALAFYSGLFAYSGWDNLNQVTREIKNPEKNMFRSMMTSCTIVTIIYVLTNISYFVVLTKAEFAASEAIAVDFGIKLFGKAGGIFMVLSIACSIFGSTTAGTLTAARVSYAAAREGHLFDLLSFLSIEYMTPYMSLIFTYILALLMSLSSKSIIDLILLSGFVDTFFIGVSMVALIVLRKTKKDGRRPIKVPIVFPLVVLVFTVFLVVSPFVNNPKPEYFFVLTFLFLGFIVYIPFVYFEYRPPGLGWVKKYSQLLFLVVPPQDHEI